MKHELIAQTRDLSINIFTHKPAVKKTSRNYI